MSRFSMRERFFGERLVPPISQVLWMISGVFCIFMMYNILTVFIHLTDRKSTNGEILSYVELPGTDRFHPKIRFSDANGNLHEFVDSNGATAPLYLIGTIVQVDYDPKNPRIAEMTTLYYRWGSTIGLFFLMMIFWVLGSRFTYKVHV
jgi:uncharacterized membrane protein